MGLGRLLSHPLVVAGLQSGALFTQQMQKDREEEEKLRREMRLKSFEYQQKNLDAERSRQQQLENQTQQLNIDVLKGAMGSNDLEKYGPAKAAVEALRRTNIPEYMKMADQFEAPMLENEAALKKAQADAARAQADAAKNAAMGKVRSDYSRFVDKSDPSSQDITSAIDNLKSSLKQYKEFEPDFQEDLDRLNARLKYTETREKAANQILLATLSPEHPEVLKSTLATVSTDAAPEVYKWGQGVLDGWQDQARREAEKGRSPTQRMQEMEDFVTRLKIEQAAGKSTAPVTNFFINGEQVSSTARPTASPTAGGAAGGWQATARARLAGGAATGNTAPIDSVLADYQRQLEPSALQGKPASVPPAPAPPVSPAPPAGQWQDQFAVTGPRPGIFDAPSAAPASGAQAAFFARKEINGAAAVPAPADTLAAPASIQVTDPWRATPADAAGLDPVDISAIEKYAQVKGLTFAQAKTELDSLATGVR